MEIPLVVGKNKCVIVSSSLYTRVNHMPEILWTWLHRELRSCDSGEAITPGPERDPDPQVSSVADSRGPPWSSPRLRPPPCPNPCPAVNETRLSSTRAQGQEAASPFQVGAGWAAMGVLGDGVIGDLLPFPLASPSPAPGAHPVLWSPSRFPQVSLHQHQQHFFFIIKFLHSIHPGFG